jgi:hypothetical protein
MAKIEKYIVRGSLVKRYNAGPILRVVEIIPPGHAPSNRNAHARLLTHGNDIVNRYRALVFASGKYEVMELSELVPLNDQR